MEQRHVELERRWGEMHLQGKNSILLLFQVQRYIRFMWAYRHVQASQARPFFHFRVHDLSVTHHTWLEEDVGKINTVLIVKITGTCELNASCREDCKTQTGTAWQGHYWKAHCTGGIGPAHQGKAARDQIWNQMIILLFSYSLFLPVE